LAALSVNPPTLIIPAIIIAVFRDIVMFFDILVLRNLRGRPDIIVMENRP